MKQTNLALTFGTLVLLAISCSQTQKPDLELEKQRILELHHAQRGYHFEKDSVSFANQLSDDFISVNRGKITYPDKEETISRYNSYFSSVQFLKWDDLSEPIIRFSDDGTIAYTIVDKIVEVEYDNENGETEVGRTHFAWTAIYKKHGDKWKIDCVTSTEVPSY
ncbi:MAG: nuclear transport factor 2 family protein [Cyclobacteriaceae bacterium]